MSVWWSLPLALATAAGAVARLAAVRLRRERQALAEASTVVGALAVTLTPGRSPTDDPDR